jgi:arylsulfatase A-like enzyme
LPTFAAVAGVTPPSGYVLDGTDILPLLQGGGQSERSLFWYMPFYDMRWGITPCAVMREGNYKLIEFFGDRIAADGRHWTGPHIELYHLAEDIGETTDRSADEPDRVRKMRQALHTWIHERDAPLPQPNPHHDPARQLQEVLWTDMPAFEKNRWQGMDHSPQVRDKKPTRNE